MTDNRKFKIPAILYETENSTLPYIEVEKDDQMPSTLFVQRYQHTGEYEPGSNGEEQPIIDMYMHMYTDMEFLQSKLSPETYDEIRVAIGLQPLEEAKKEGQQKLDRAYNAANKEIEKKLTQKEQYKQDTEEEVNKKLSEKFFKKVEPHEQDSNNSNGKGEN